MAFQIDPNIPLQAMANPINIGDAFAKAQSYQANALKLQALRDKFDEEKAEKLRQKQMRQGMASELQKMQQGTPAQYDVSFPQTMPTGQMPSGMSGVLANERGQNMPQPALFGENILQGDFDINREVVSPAIAPKQPDIKDVLTAQFNAAMAAQDAETAFDAAKKLKELEKNPNKYFSGLTKGIDPKTGQPLFLAMTETGVVPVDGYQPYEEPMSAKEVKANNLAERKFRAEQAERQRQYDLDYKKHIADLNKPDPVEKALTLADARADTKIKQELVNDATVFTRDYSTVKPLIMQAQQTVEKLPPDAIQTYLQAKMAGYPISKYFGNPEQQLAIRNLDMVMENMRLLAEKPVGNLTMGEQQMVAKSVGIITDLNSSKEQKVDAVNTLANIYESKETMHKNVLKKFGKEDFNLFTETSKFSLSATPAQKQQYDDAIKRASGNQEQIKQINFIAKKQGVIK